MLLYHYTTFAAFFGEDQLTQARDAALDPHEPITLAPAISELRPNAAQTPEWKPVVWLTREAVVDGPPPRGYCRANEGAGCYIRVSVAIPSSDPRLIPMRKAWRQQNLAVWQARHAVPYPGDPPLLDPRARHWWAYAGMIPSSS